MSGVCPQAVSRRSTSAPNSISTATEEALPDAAAKCSGVTFPVVVSGVEAAKRFEWTPIYFKELDVTGSNAFAIEEIDGVRKHAMQWYVEMCEQGLDVTALISHRFALSDWRKAFDTLMNKGKTGALKIVLEPDEG